LYLLSDKLHKTKGIVLRAVKYGETSIIATIYTELFGGQSYLINGVRTASKKGANKTSFFQPAALLDLVVYHNEFKQLHRIREYRWSYIYQNIYATVVTNGVAMYMVELLSKCLKQPEANADLFAFTEDCFLHLDTAPAAVLANFPVFFAIQLTNFFGFSPGNTHAQMPAQENFIFDIQEGKFTTDLPIHNLYLERKYAIVLAELLQVQQPFELSEIETNSDTRRHILDALETYYSLHIQDFGSLKTLPVLREIIAP
jgi:DNA repair protein RecO (recombination protein O)